MVSIVWSVLTPSIYQFITTPRSRPEEIESEENGVIYTVLCSCNLIPGHNWRAGASQPSRTSGSDFSIYIYIYRYMGIYITGAAHTVIPIQRQHAHKIAISVHLTIYIYTVY